MGRDVVAGDDQDLDRARCSTGCSRDAGGAGWTAAAVAGSDAISSSGMGPKTGTAMSIPSVRLQ